MECIMAWFSDYSQSIRRTKVGGVSIVILHALQVHLFQSEKCGGLDCGNGAGLSVQSICNWVLFVGRLLDHATELLKNGAPTGLAIAPICNRHCL